jgi:hypothetical protein
MTQKEKIEIFYQKIEEGGFPISLLNLNLILNLGNGI